MAKILRYIPDFAVLAVLYVFWLYPRWRHKGKRILVVNTLMYVYLSGVLMVTLMPMITSLPLWFNHPYIPMHMVPFEDVLYGRGDYIRQIILNIFMMVPFGFLYPLCRRNAGKNCGLLRCLLASLLLSLAIEVLQPLINGARSADITDVITNTAGGALGYTVYALFGRICGRL